MADFPMTVELVGQDIFFLVRLTVENDERRHFHARPGKLAWIHPWRRLSGHLTRSLVSRPWFRRCAARPFAPVSQASGASPLV